MTGLLYQDDPLLLDFSAEVIETFRLPDGRVGALLRETAFYPTGGGQEHDTGFIGQASVLDVYKDGDRVVHVLDRDLPCGAHPARVDRERRLRAMQHHTAQHILSACFLREAGLPTVSANINGDTPSTLDLQADGIAPEALERVERAANAVVFEDRPVKFYFITDADVPRIPFRRPPKVSGRIRVVEVEGLDYSPCGGTHCPCTGMIGLIKIVRTENINHKLRVHFVAGWQALETFRLLHEATRRTADLLSARPEDLPALAQRLLDQTAALRAELEALRTEAMGAEAHRLAQEAEAIGGRRLVVRRYVDRPVAELRLLGSRLAAGANLVAVLAAQEGGKLSLVVAAAPGSGVDARDLLTRLLAPLGGRGGGDASLAQGGARSEVAIETILEQAGQWILSQPSTPNS